MAASAERLGKKLTSQYEKSVSFFKSLPDFIWDERLYTDGAEWTVHQVFAHIVEVEGSILYLMISISQGGTGVGPDFDIDRYNASAVRKISTKSREELFSLFEERRTRMLAFVDGLPPEVLALTGNHPYLGEAKLGEMLKMLLLHINGHIRDIRKAFGETLGE
jgi:hypothetical protein